MIGDELNQVNKQTNQIEKVKFEDWYKRFKPTDAGEKFIIFYFGSHWSPPSRVFTEILDEQFYKKVNKDGLNAEVVFVSDDRTEDAYNHNLLNGCIKSYTNDENDDEEAPMPWVAITWENKKLRNNLKLRYIIHTQPSTVVVIWEHPNEIGKEEIRLIKSNANKDITNPEEALKTWAKEVKDPWKDDPKV